MKAAGIVLLIVGLALTVFTGIKYFTNERVMKIGKLEVDKEQPHTIYWSPFVGVGLMVIGGVLVWQGSKSTGKLV